jgi:hypothetical protein
MIIERKNMFFNKNKEPEYKETPLNLRVGCSVTINTLDWKLMQDKINMSIPTETFIIGSYGVTEVNDNTKIHKFYANSNELFIQVVEEFNKITEIKLFTVHDTVFPSSDDDWLFWLGNKEEGGYIGDFEIHLKNGSIYYRSWNENTTSNIPPVDFHENRTSETSNSYYEYRSMEYARWIDEKETMPEWLLVQMEDTGNSACIKFYLGFTILENNLTIF